MKNNRIGAMKLLLLSIFLSLSICGDAQKSYINVYASSLNNSSNGMYLTGDIPLDIKKSYSIYDNTTIGQLLNMLSERGYEVEFMSGMSDNCANYLLSKKSPGQSNAIQKVRVDSDEDVTEVARYNLQGMPVDESEKGIQIIVYSNYTTKTVIVQ